MSENEKQGTMTFIVPDFEEIEAEPTARVVSMGLPIRKTIKTLLGGRVEEVDYKKSLEEFNGRIVEILRLLSDSQSNLGEFKKYQIETVTFSLGVKVEGDVAIWGIGGASAGADAGVQVTMVRKQ